MYALERNYLSGFSRMLSIYLIFLGKYFHRSCYGKPPYGTYITKGFL